MKAHAHTDDTLADAAGERAKQYVDAGVTAYHAASDKTRAMTKQVDGYVRENPWWVIGAAAGLGVLFGMLIRRR